MGAVVFVGIFAMAFGASVLRGWVLSYLWQWFVVPLGAPSIGIAWAIGLAGLIAMLTYKRDFSEKQETADPMAKMGKAFAVMFFFPILSLLVGWLAHAAMVG